MGWAGVTPNAVTRNVLIEAAVRAGDRAAADALWGEYGCEPPLPSLMALDRRAEDADKEEGAAPGPAADLGGAVPGGR